MLTCYEWAGNDILLVLIQLECKSNYSGELAMYSLQKDFNSIDIKLMYLALVISALSAKLIDHKHTDSLAEMRIEITSQD